MITSKKTKSLLRYIIRRLGIEVKKYNIHTSEEARMKRLLAYHSIDLVLDVGANVGQYANFLRQLGYRGRIVSFEPVISNHEKLLCESRNDPLWKISPLLAIGDVDSHVLINVAGNSESSSVLDMLDQHVISAPGSRYVSHQKVNMRKLDSIFTEYALSATSIFLKIDVQGYEYKVLTGAQGVLSQIKGIQLELSLVPLYEGELLYNEMIEFMHSLGFSLKSVLTTNSFSDEQSGEFFQIDAIFFKSSV